MTNFVLIDLASQADAVWQCVGGLSQLEILAWLSDRGTVTHIQHSMDAHFYSFRSGIGIETTFRLTTDGQLWIYRGEYNFYNTSCTTSAKE